MNIDNFQEEAGNTYVNVIYFAFFKSELPPRVVQW